MSVEQLGEPLTGTYSVPGGEARLYERGVTISGIGGHVIVEFRFPMLGTPHIAAGDAAAVSVFERDAVTFRLPAAWQFDTLVTAIRHALDGRVALVPTGGQAGPAPVVFGAVEALIPTETGVDATFGFPASALVQERQLYDVALLTDSGQWKVVAPHAVYFRSSWSDFGIAHITDIHAARRIDYFRGKLEELGRHEAAGKMYNWNDRFRGFIRYANYLHSTGVLDIILATGDIFDYIFENDDDENGGGNALFARELILGQAPGPHFPDVEELRVPIFMVGGNHDYRKYPYRLLFNLDIGPLLSEISDFLGERKDRRVSTFASYHLPWRDALALSRGDNSDDFPELNVDSAARMVEVDPENRPYMTHLTAKREYVIRLGPHRIVMLDSLWDTGMLTDRPDLVRKVLRWLSEDEATFVGGSPNSVGVSDSAFNLVGEALEETPDGALFILGIHAPLLNFQGNTYPYFLRETQRAALPHQVTGFLDRLDGKDDKDDRKTAERHPTWFPAERDHRAPRYVKRGDTSDYLDYSVSRGRADDLLRLLAGIGARRSADVVLSGHTHWHNEFRLGAANGELEFYMDFYTQNPAQYYPTRFLKTRHFGSEEDTDVTYVHVVEDAPANATPSEMPYDAMHRYVVAVPPYPNPLAAASDPRAWWAEHRPLVLQTGAVGPLENSQVSFSGFRVVSVKDDVIERIHHVSMEKLHASNYQLPWEDAIRPEPPRRHLHAQRSKEYGTPAAAGAPFGYVFPPTGAQNLIYRDSSGQLFELWRDSGGATGYGNLTQAAQATPAAGDPYVYLDTVAGLQIVLYRGKDGHVHSLYWSTGAVGHDNLGGAARAPRAAGDPVGFLNTATNYHHVTYRSDDGHLHTLWWTGQDAVGRDETTALAGAPPAAGDPSAYFDPVRGNSLVIYRGRDGHIHSLYWSTGAVSHENLSGFIGSPLAAGDPVAYKTAHDDAHQVTYRSGDGHLHEL